MRKRFSICGVEVKEGGRRDYILHLIDLVGGRFYRFSSREEVGDVVACLCSPGYANSIREECLDEAREGGVVHLPNLRQSSQASLDDQEDFAQSLHEMDPQALEGVQELDRILKDWQSLIHKDEDHLAEEPLPPVFIEGLDEVIPEEEVDEGLELAQEKEIEAFIPYLAEDHDFGSGPLFDFERDFTFNIEDVPAELRDQYHIISFETATVAAMQYDQIKNVIDRALEDVGVKKPTPKEVVPTGVMDCGCQDDALAFEGMSFMKAR